MKLLLETKRLSLETVAVVSVVVRLLVRYKNEQAKSDLPSRLLKRNYKLSLHFEFKK